MTKIIPNPQTTGEKIVFLMAATGQVLLGSELPFPGGTRHSSFFGQKHPSGKWSDKPKTFKALNENGEASIFAPKTKGCFSSDVSVSILFNDVTNSELWVDYQGNGTYNHILPDGTIHSGKPSEGGKIVEFETHNICE